MFQRFFDEGLAQSSFLHIHADFVPASREPNVGGGMTLVRQCL
jgi:hypothetical protein